MGRKSEAAPLLKALRASDVARERVKVVLLTLGGAWRVKDALERLSISRTRFQALRQRMLQAALQALEPGPIGRPPRALDPARARVRELESRVSDLTHELHLTRTRLELAEGPAARAIRRRLIQTQESRRRSER